MSRYRDWTEVRGGNPSRSVDLWSFPQPARPISDPRKRGSRSCWRTAVEVIFLQWGSRPRAPEHVDGTRGMVGIRRRAGHAANFEALLEVLIRHFVHLRVPRDSPMEG